MAVVALLVLLLGSFGGLLIGQWKGALPLGAATGGASSTSASAARERTRRCS